MTVFKAATRTRARLRLALTGPSGSGKTYSALAIAAGLGERVAVIDTEQESASLYADQFSFDSTCLDSFSPESYVEALGAAASAGYEVIVIDSLSHAWIGRDGALEQVDLATRRSGSKNSYFAWRDVTPKHNALVEAIVRSPAHVIATMRAKTEYAVDRDEKGRTVPRKVGLGPVQREGMEYEFTIAGDLDLEHCLRITKSRCSALAGKVIEKPGAELANVLRKWLDGVPGEAAPAPARDRVRASIRSAQTMEELEALLPQAQQLSDVDRELVRPEFTRRRDELRSATGADGSLSRKRERAG